MNIQAVTCLLVAAVLASLASGGASDWEAPPLAQAGAGEVAAEGYYYGPRGAGGLVSAPGAADGVDGEQRRLEELVLRLLRANAERAAAFRRETRQPHFTPRKPSCHGNSCNQRGWKRSYGQGR